MGGDGAIWRVERPIVEQGGNPSVCVCGGVLFPCSPFPNCVYRAGGREWHGANLQPLATSLLTNPLAAGLHAVCTLPNPSSWEVPHLPPPLGLPHPSSAE